MNTENQNTDPALGENQGSELEETVGWIINVVLKVGAGYLAKVIIDALF